MSSKVAVMKTILMIGLSFSLASCFNKNGDTQKVDSLNQRITQLEQKIDSLLGIRNGASVGLNNTDSPGTTSYKSTRGDSRCQATTKKGTQCKRKAKTNSYCWQHGG